MDSQCLQLQRSPIHVVLWGSSEGLAHCLFEMTQKAECPRKLVFTLIEYPGEESAAVLQMRAVRMRGIQDSSFEDQFTWLRTTDPEQRISDKVRSVLEAMQDALCVTVFAEIQQSFMNAWDTLLWNAIPKMKHDSDLLSLIPNAQSRLKPTKKIQVEWVSLHMEHPANFLDVVFPSHVLFGSRLALLQLFQDISLDWPTLPWKCFPLWAAQSKRKFTGLILLESPSKIVHDIDSWNARLDPKVDSILQKTIMSKYNFDSVFSEMHSLGLDPESASNLEIILKQGSIKELHTNLNHIRAIKDT